MPSEEEKARRKERNRQLAEQRRIAETPIEERGLDPRSQALAKLGRAALSVVDYPRYGVSEGITRSIEAKQAAQEAMGPETQGFLPNVMRTIRGQGAVAGQLGREAISDVLDVASDVSRILPGDRLIPESWGQNIDPSTNVQFGQQVEDKRQMFREQYGREPGIIETYDLVAKEQDKVMPWLTERHEIGPVSFSNRALLEAGAEAGAIAGEVALTGGQATLARKTLQGAAKIAAKTTASQAGKGLTRESIAKAAGKTILGGGRVAAEAMQPLVQMDRLGSLAVRKVIWPALKPARVGVSLGVKGAFLPLRGGIATGKATAGTLKYVMNGFRREAIVKGANALNVNKKAVELIEEAAREGSLTDGTQLDFTQRGANIIFDSEIDNAIPRKNIDNMVTDSDEYNSFRPISETVEGQKILNQETSRMAINLENVRNIPSSALDYAKNIRKSLVGGALRAEQPKWVKEHLDLVKLMRGAFTAANDAWLNRRDALRTTSRGLAVYYINALHQAGLMTFNVGKRDARAVTNRLSEALTADQELALASGNSMEGLVRTIDKLGDKKVSLEELMGNNSMHMPKERVGQPTGPQRELEGLVVEEETLKGWTRITVDEYTNVPTYYTKMEQGVPAAAGDVRIVRVLDELGNPVSTLDEVTGISTPEYMWVSNNLDPALADVVENIGYYKRQLSSVKNVVQRIDADGNPIPGSYMNALEVVEELADILRKNENALSKTDTGAGVAFTSKSVTYGGRYFPRNPLMDATIDSSKVTAAGEMPIGKYQSELEPKIDDKGMLGRKVPASRGRHRTYMSQAEGQFDGVWYVHPAHAIEDYSNYVSQQIIADKQGAFIRQAAEIYGIQHGSVEEILGDSAKAINEYTDKLKTALDDAIREQQKANIKMPRQKIERAKALMHDINNWQKLDVRFGWGGEVEDGQNIIARYLDELTVKFDEWNKEVAKIQGIQRFKAQNVKQLRSALQRSENAIKSLKTEVKDAFRPIAGVALENVYFPKIFADAVAKSVAGLQGQTEQGIRGTALSIQATMRLMGATGDLSAAGIQGWTGILNDTLQAGGIASELDAINDVRLLKLKRGMPAYEAFLASIKAFAHAGDEIVAEHLWRADQIAKQTGMLTPNEAANEGLAILNNAPDLYFSEGFTRNIPGIKNADAAFTHFGNVFRWGSFDTEMAIQIMKTGKTPKELIADGTVKDIAQHVNMISGVGRRGFMGNLGQFLLFAPRFFHSRFKFLYTASRGLVPGVEKTTAQRVAAQHFSRAMGTATYLTFMLNEASGYQTDINPILYNSRTKTVYFNPNFMRVRIGNLDVSLFGPWDSVMRIMALAPIAAVNSVNKGNVGEFATAFRKFVSAPGTSALLDALYGSDVMGQKLLQQHQDTDSFFKKVALGTTGVLEQLTPFAWDEVLFGQPGQPTVPQRIWGSLKKGASNPIEAATGTVTGAGQLAMNFAGIKSTYMSVNEEINAGYIDVLDAMTMEDKLEAFGVTSGNMTEEEMEAIWAGIGENWFTSLAEVGDDWSLKVGFGWRGRFGDPLPKWTDLASDIQNNIEQQIRSGRYSSVMSADEYAEFNQRIKDRRERSARPYDEYKILMEDSKKKEFDTITRIEEAWSDQVELGGDITFKFEVPQRIDGKDVITTDTEKINYLDYKAFGNLIKQVKQKHASYRRSLTDPETGEFATVISDLFPDSDLRKNATFDADIYTNVESLYYDLIFDGTEGLKLPLEPIEQLKPAVSPTTGDMDWDQKDRNELELRRQIAALHPFLTEGQIDRYLWRVEDNMEKDLPEISKHMHDIQKAISREPMLGGKTFYELDQLTVDEIIRTQKTFAGREVVQEHVAKWQAAEMGEVKKQIVIDAEAEGVYGLDRISSRRESAMDAFFAMTDPQTMQQLQPHSVEWKVEQHRRGVLESWLIILDKRGSESNPPVSPRGKATRDIIILALDGQIPNFDMGTFIQYVRSENHSAENLRVLYPRAKQERR